MKKHVNTPIESTGDELVRAVLSAKKDLENGALTVQRTQSVMSLLPEASTEYKELELDLMSAKWVLVCLIREYERCRENLSKHCDAYALTGNTFGSAYSLLEIVTRK